MIWVTKEGRRLRLDDMTTDHLRHCVVKIIFSRFRWRARFLRAMLAELEIRAYLHD